MKTEENYLDKLVLNAFPDNIASERNVTLWNGIRKTLRFKKFFKLSLNTFNVYYSAIILTAVVSTSVYYICKDAGNSSPTGNINCQQQPAAENNVAPDQAQSANSERAGEAQISPVCGQNMNKAARENAVKEPSTVTKDAIDLNIVDKEPLLDNASKAKKVKVVKKQLVITDTIRKKDTVIIRK